MTGQQGGLAPHPPLTQWYTAPEARTAFVQSLFDGTARHYDRVCATLALGTGNRYRRRMLRQAGFGPGMRLLDVAIGTGLVAREAVRIAGDAGAVIGLDPSPGMLAEARRTLGPETTLLQGKAEDIPLPDASVDMVSMGYGLRHVADLTAAFREYHRVLRPGGRLLLLEKARPRTPARVELARFWITQAVPPLSVLFTGVGLREARDLMRYYWDTVERCVPPQTILRALSQAGFADPACATQFDLLSTYTARKPG